MAVVPEVRIHMIKSYTAFTNEIDDVELAVSEILEQLDLEGKLLGSTVGILSCFAEYIESGVVAALCAKLPFDVVGTTTIANAAPNIIGETMLNLMVMTSDDVVFKAGLTDPILSEDITPFRDSYQKASAGMEGQPKAILSFAPLLFNVGGDFYVESFAEVSGRVPNFGTLAVDHNPDYHQSCVIYNGAAWRDRYGFVLMYGNVNPRYYIGTISEEKIFSEKSVVTASAGYQLQTINGQSVIDYLLSLGFEKNEEGAIPGINSFPLIVDYNDGTKPVVRAMFALTPDGHAVCGGDIPKGATLAIGEFDSKEIRITTEATLKKALGENDTSALLIYSCVGRYFAQGANQTIEMENIKSQLEQAGIPYLFAYSGGEICPVYTKEGGLTTRNHNSTVVILAI